MPAKKKNTEKVVKESVKKASKKYSLKVELNGEVFKFKTDHIARSILSIKPYAIKTATKVTLKKGSKSVERVIFVPAARRLFRNEISAQTLAKNLVMTL